MRLSLPLAAIIATVVTSIAAFGILAALALPAKEHPFFEPETQHSNPAVIAHRGGAGLWPENTLYAFKQATALGVDILDMDVRTSADGVLILMNDHSVDQTTNGQGPVAQMTVAELQVLDAAFYWSDDNGKSHRYRNHAITIPTMAEVFVTFPEIRMSIEMKDSDEMIAINLCALIHTYDAIERVLAKASTESVLQKFREVCPDVATSASNKEEDTFLMLNLTFLSPAYNPDFHALQVPQQRNGIRIITLGFVQAAHERGLKVYAQSINKEDNMQIVHKLGVDGIITDYPDLLLTVIGQH